MEDFRMHQRIAGLVGGVMIATTTMPAFAASNEYALGQMSLAPSSLLSEAPVAFLGASQKKDPWMAVGLSMGIPTLWLGAGLVITDYNHANDPYGTHLYIGVPLTLTSFLGLGAGQMYAGDTLRGVLVGLGCYPVVFLGWAVGGSNLLYGSALAYGAWALYDAYQTTRRVNDEQ